MIFENEVFGERLRETFAPPQDDEFAKLVAMLDAIEIEMEAGTPEAR